MIIYEAKQTYAPVGIIEGKHSLDEPTRVAAYMEGAFDEFPLQEQVWIIMLNRKNMPIARERCTLGTMTAAHVAPDVVFRAAILAGATALILAHNHPSGDPSPSSADITVTKKLIQAGKILSIEIHDHIIIGHDRYYSFSDRGLI